MFDLLPGASALERRVLRWMCVIVGINQLGFGAMVPALPLYAESFGVSLWAVGMAIAVYGLARCLAALPTGQLADWLGRRPTLAIGGIVTVAGNLGCALVDDYSWFLVYRFVSGAGAALVLTTGIVVLADISRPERRGRMMAIYQGVFLFSVGIGPFPGGLLAERYGLDAPFFAYAIAAAAVTVVAWFAVAETKHLQEHPRRGDGEAVSYRAQLAELCRRSSILLVCSVSFVHAFTRTGGIFAVVPILGASLIGLSASQIGTGMALGSVIGLLVIYPSGAIADRYGRKTVIVPATLMTACAFGLFFLADSYWSFVAASALWGVASSMGGSAPAAYTADSAPPGMNAAAMSTFRMLSDVGYVAGPITMGAIADFYGPAWSIMIAGFMLLAVGTAFGLLAPESHRNLRRG